MRILVVAATDQEIAPIRARCRNFDSLVTGVGMVATAAWCSSAFAREEYDLALNVGVCGSFDPDIALLSAVHVATDRFSELGAEDDDRFVTIHDLGLLDADAFPFRDGRLVNPDPPSLVRELRTVDGITVNTVHGNDQSIAAVVKRFTPQVESMEGAAFMYACLIHHVPFAQVRVVSNMVERRHRASWKLAEAVLVLADTTVSLLSRV